MVENIKSILDNVTLPQEKDDFLADYEQTVAFFDELVEQGLAKRRTTILPLIENSVNFKNFVAYKN